MHVSSQKIGKMACLYRFAIYYMAVLNTANYFCTLLIEQTIDCNLTAHNSYTYISHIIQYSTLNSNSWLYMYVIRDCVSYLSLHDSLFRPKQVHLWTSTQYINCPKLPHCNQYWLAGLACYADTFLLIRFFFALFLVCSMALGPIIGGTLATFMPISVCAIIIAEVVVMQV